jgi:hypothetical protein
MVTNFNMLINMKQNGTGNTCFKDWWFLVYLKRLWQVSIRG